MINEEEALVIDTETNALRNPSKIHVICTRTFSGETKEYLNVHSDKAEQARFIEDIKKFKYFVGHNIIQYDLLEVLDRLVPNHGIDPSAAVDTLVIVRLLNYGLPGGHSLAAWGERFGVTKVGQDIEVWDEPTPDMFERCHSDTEINLRILKRFLKYLKDPEWEDALRLEHDTAYICGVMTQNGFPFDMEAALRLHTQITDLVTPIDEALSTAFPPRPVPIRVVNPRRTKSGAFNLNDFRWYGGDDLSIFTGGPFTVIRYEEFNPASPKQIVERLNAAGWKPTDKTKGHQEALKNRKTPPERLAEYKQYGWKVNEENLKTLPDTAPEAAKALGKRLILNSRLSDLEEWMALAVEEQGEHVIHGQFNPIGAWTHRLSHSRPNLANVPVAKRSPKDNEFETLVNDLNDEMRGLWIARKGHRLVGTDADGLQMRIFAHYVDDEDLINALIQGSKDDGTDIHSLHQKKLGEPCKSRDAAKTFIYAWLLGAGTGKVSEILETTPGRAKGAVASFIASYPGLKYLKDTVIPQDARKGYFVGLDGRKVICNNEHLMLAGYLQNGEAIIMKGACREWQAELRRLGIPFRMCTWPHDEWQTEIPDDDDICEEVQRIQIQAIRNQAVRLNLKCPLDGSSSWGYTWKETH